MDFRFHIFGKVGNKAGTSVRCFLIFFLCLQTQTTGTPRDREYLTLFRRSDILNLPCKTLIDRTNPVYRVTENGIMSTLLKKSIKEHDLVVLFNNGECATLNPVTIDDINPKEIVFQQMPVSAKMVLEDKWFYVQVYSTTISPDIPLRIFIANGNSCVDGRCTKFILKTYRALEPYDYYTVTKTAGRPGSLVNPKHDASTSTSPQFTLEEIYDVYELFAPTGLINMGHQATATYIRSKKEYFVDTLTELPAGAETRSYVLAKDNKLLENMYHMIKVSYEDTGSSVIILQAYTHVKPPADGVEFLHGYTAEPLRKLMYRIPMFVPKKRNLQETAVEYLFPLPISMTTLAGDVHALVNSFNSLEYNAYAEIKFRKYTNRYGKDFAIFVPFGIEKEVRLHEQYWDGAFRFLGSDLQAIVIGLFPNIRCKIIGVGSRDSETLRSMYAIRITHSSIQGHTFAEYDINTEGEVENPECQTLHFKPLPLERQVHPALPEFFEGERLLVVTDKTNRIVLWCVKVNWTGGDSCEESTSRSFTLVNNCATIELKRSLSDDDGRPIEGMELVISPGDNKQLQMEIEVISHKDEKLTSGANNITTIFNVRIKKFSDQNLQYEQPLADHNPNPSPSLTHQKADLSVPQMQSSDPGTTDLGSARTKGSEFTTKMDEDSQTGHPRNTTPQAQTETAESAGSPPVNTTNDPNAKVDTTQDQTQADLRTSTTPTQIIITSEICSLNDSKSVPKLNKGKSNSEQKLSLNRKTGYPITELETSGSRDDRKSVRTLNKGKSSSEQKQKPISRTGGATGELETSGTLIQGPDFPKTDAPSNVDTLLAQNSDQENRNQLRDRKSEIICGNNRVEQPSQSGSMNTNNRTQPPSTETFEQGTVSEQNSEKGSEAKKPAVLGGPDTPISVDPSPQHVPQGDNLATQDICFMAQCDQFGIAVKQEKISIEVLQDGKKIIFAESRIPDNNMYGFGCKGTLDNFFKFVGDASSPPVKSMNWAAHTFEKTTLEPGFTVIHVKSNETHQFEASYAVKERDLADFEKGAKKYSYTLQQQSRTDFNKLSVADIKKKTFSLIDKKLDFPGSQCFEWNGKLEFINMQGAYYLHRFGTHGECFEILNFSVALRLELGDKNQRQFRWKDAENPPGGSTFAVVSTTRNESYMEYVTHVGKGLFKPVLEPPSGITESLPTDGSRVWRYLHVYSVGGVCTETFLVVSNSNLGNYRIYDEKRSEAWKKKKTEELDRRRFGLSPVRSVFPPIPEKSAGIIFCTYDKISNTFLPKSNSDSINNSKPIEKPVAPSTDSAQNLSRKEHKTRFFSLQPISTLIKSATTRKKLPSKPTKSVIGESVLVIQCDDFGKIVSENVIKGTLVEDSTVKSVHFGTSREPDGNKYVIRSQENDTGFFHFKFQADKTKTYESLEYETDTWKFEPIKVEAGNFILQVYKVIGHDRSFLVKRKVNFEETYDQGLQKYIMSEPHCTISEVHAEAGSQLGGVDTASVENSSSETLKDLRTMTLKLVGEKTSVSNIICFEENKQLEFIEMRGLFKLYKIGEFGECSVLLNWVDWNFDLKFPGRKFLLRSDNFSSAINAIFAVAYIDANYSYMEYVIYKGKDPKSFWSQHVFESVSVDPPNIRILSRQTNVNSRKLLHVYTGGKVIVNSVTVIPLQRGTQDPNNSYQPETNEVITVWNKNKKSADFLYVMSDCRFPPAYNFACYSNPPGTYFSRPKGSNHLQPTKNKEELGSMVV